MSNCTAWDSQSHRWTGRLNSWRQRLAPMLAFPEPGGRPLARPSGDIVAVGQRPRPSPTRGLFLSGWTLIDAGAHARGEPAARPRMATIAICGWVCRCSRRRLGDGRLLGGLAAPRRCGCCWSACAGLLLLLPFLLGRGRLQLYRARVGGGVGPCWWAGHRAAVRGAGGWA